MSHAQQITSTISEPGVGFTITSCFISPNSDPSVPSDYILMETVCPTDDSVHYIQEDSPAEKVEKKIFSFTFNSKFNMKLLHLHCEISLCSKNSQRNRELPEVCNKIFSKYFYSLEYFNIMSVKLESGTEGEFSVVKVKNEVKVHVRVISHWAAMRWRRKS